MLYYNVLLVLFVLFMYTASVMFDYFCRDSELSYIGSLSTQSHLTTCYASHRYAGRVISAEGIDEFGWGGGGGLGSSLHLLWRELGGLTCLRVTLPRTRNLLL